MRYIFQIWNFRYRDYILTDFMFFHSTYLLNDVKEKLQTYNDLFIKIQWRILEYQDRQFFSHQLKYTIINRKYVIFRQQSLHKHYLPKAKDNYFCIFRKVLFIYDTLHWKYFLYVFDFSFIVTAAKWKGRTVFKKVSIKK